MAECFKEKSLSCWAAVCGNLHRRAERKKVFSYKIFRNILAHLGKEDRNLQLLEGKAHKKSISDLNIRVLFILA